MSGKETCVYMCLGVQAAQRNQVTLVTRGHVFTYCRKLVSLHPCLGLQHVRVQTCIFFFFNQFLFYFFPKFIFFLLLCFSVCVCVLFCFVFYMGFKPLLVFARIYMLPIDIMTAELSKQGKQAVTRVTTMATIEKPE